MKHIVILTILHQSDSATHVPLHPSMHQLKERFYSVSETQFRTLNVTKKLAKGFFFFFPVLILCFITLIIPSRASGTLKNFFNSGRRSANHLINFKRPIPKYNQSLLSSRSSWFFFIFNQETTFSCGPRKNPYQMEKKVAICFFLLYFSFF